MKRYYNLSAKEVFVENIPFDKEAILLQIKNSIRGLIAIQVKINIASQENSIQDVLRDKLHFITNINDDYKLNDT